MSNYGRYSGMPFQRTYRAGNKPNRIDTHEILRQEIMSQSSSPASASSDSSSNDSSAAPIVGFADTYMYFDSNARNFGLSNISIGTYAYDVPPLNSSFPVENIVAMRLNSFYVPSINNAATVPNYFFFARIYLRVSSSSMATNASVQAANNTYYHFELDIENFTSVALLLTPLRNIFYFNSPIQSLSDITFTFYRQPDFDSISFPNDVITVLGLAGTNPAQFQVISSGDDTTGIAPVGVPPAPGVAVYLTNFISANSALNNQVNSSNGYFVDNVISTTNFSISQLNFTTLLANTQTTVTIAKNRIAFDMEFITVKPTTTNSLTAIHE